MEMIRSKVYQLEQAQLKMKAEYVASLVPSAVGPLLTTGLSLAMKPRFEFCVTSWNRAESRQFPLTSEALRRMVLLLRHHRPHWATVLVICLVASWPTKEVVVPVLPLPLPRISSRPNIPFNSLPPGRSKDRLSLRRALLGDTSPVLL